MDAVKINFKIGPSMVDAGLYPHQGRAAIGGSGVDALRDRADAATLQVPGHHRASQMPGELPDQDRA